MVVPITVNTTEGDKIYNINFPENPKFSNYINFLHSLAELAEDETLIPEAQKMEALECLGIDVSKLNSLPNDLDALLEGIIDTAVKLIERIEPYQIKSNTTFKVGLMKFRMAEKTTARRLGLVSVSARRAIEALYVNEKYIVKEEDKPTDKVIKMYKSAVNTFAYLTCKEMPLLLRVLLRVFPFFNRYIVGYYLPKDPEALQAFINKKATAMQKHLSYKDVKSIGFFLSSILAKYEAKKNMNTYSKEYQILGQVNQILNKSTTKRKLKT